MIFAEESDVVPSHPESGQGGGGMRAVLIVEDAELKNDRISQLLEDDSELLFARDGRFVAA